MFFIVMFFAMPVLALCYTIYVVNTEGKAKRSSYVTPLASPITFYSTVDSIPSSQRRREIKWISTKEFEALFPSSDEIVFIDLRPQARKEPIPFSLTNVLCIDSSQVLEILKWLPAESSAVLYGTSDLCASVLWTTRNISGFAPFYVLTEAPMHFEVA
jgi:hypothetical protein